MFWTTFFFGQNQNLNLSSLNLGLPKDTEHTFFVKRAPKDNSSKNYNAFSRLGPFQRQSCPTTTIPRPAYGTTFPRCTGFKLTNSGSGDWDFNRRMRCSCQPYQITRSSCSFATRKIVKAEKGVYIYFYGPYFQGRICGMITYTGWVWGVALLY